MSSPSKQESPVKIGATMIGLADLLWELCGMRCKVERGGEKDDEDNAWVCRTGKYDVPY
jgi:hypothetical protein